MQSWILISKIQLLNLVYAFYLKPEVFFCCLITVDKVFLIKIQTDCL